MARETGAEAYRRIQASGLLGRLQLLVYRILCDEGALTSGEVDAAVSKRTGKISRSGSPRLPELVTRGLVEERRKRKCRASGMSVLEYAIIPGAVPKAKTRKSRAPSKDQIKGFCAEVAEVLVDTGHTLTGESADVWAWLQRKTGS